MAASSRPLRRKLAVFQDLHEDDRVGILALLAEPERDAVLRIIGGGAKPADDTAISTAGSLVLPEGISDWLRDRLTPDARGVPAVTGVTDHCLAALRAAVADLVPQPRPKHGWAARFEGLLPWRPR